MKVINESSNFVQMTEESNLKMMLVIVKLAK